MEWFAPDSFANDWYGYLTNQTGHFVLGLFAWAMLAWWRGRLQALAIVAALYAMWEAFQLFLVFDIWDALEDWFFVMAGAVSGWLASVQRFRAATVVIISVIFTLIKGIFNRRGSK